MASIKLRFITEAGPISFILRKFMWSSISHVEFVMPTGYLGAREKGVWIRKFDYCKPKREIFGSVECDDATAKKVLDFARSQIGKSYDFWSILLGFPLRLDVGSKDDKRWFCSELVYCSFLAAGIDLLNGRKADRVTPQDILESPLVKIEGAVK